MSHSGACKSCGNSTFWDYNGHGSVRKIMYYAGAEEAHVISGWEDEPSSPEVWGLWCTRCGEELTEIMYIPEKK